MTVSTLNSSSSRFVSRQFTFTVVWLSAFLFPTPTIAQDPSRNQDQASVQRLLAEGDQLSEKPFDQKQALEKYTQALLIAPNDYEVLRRLSRTYVAIADHLKAHTDEEKNLQLGLYKKALEYANKAIAVNPNGSLGYTWRATANGRIALFEIGWTSITLAKQMKTDLERALEIDPRNDLAWYVLGRTHLKASEWPKILRWPVGMAWASLDVAIDNFEKAISIRPDVIMYHLDCARAYIASGERDKAQNHLALIQTLPNMWEEDENFRAQAKALLETMKEEDKR